MKKILLFFNFLLSFSLLSTDFSAAQNDNPIFQHRYFYPQQKDQNTPSKYENYPFGHKYYDGFTGKELPDDYTMSNISLKKLCERSFSQIQEFINFVCKKEPLQQILFERFIQEPQNIPQKNIILAQNILEESLKNGMKGAGSLELRGTNNDRIHYSVCSIVFNAKNNESFVFNIPIIFISGTETTKNISNAISKFINPKEEDCEITIQKKIIEGINTGPQIIASTCSAFVKCISDFNATTPNVQRDAHSERAIFVFLTRFNITNTLKDYFLKDKNISHIQLHIYSKHTPCCACDSFLQNGHLFYTVNQFSNNEKIEFWDIHSSQDIMTQNRTELKIINNDNDSINFSITVFALNKTSKNDTLNGDSEKPYEEEMHETVTQTPQSVTSESQSVIMKSSRKKALFLKGLNKLSLEDNTSSQKRDSLSVSNSESDETVENTKTQDTETQDTEKKPKNKKRRKTSQKMLQSIGG